MSNSNTALTTRSDKLFAAAFNLAIQGRHHESDDVLGLAHEMRKLEQRIAHIAQHAPTGLSVLLVKATMAGFDDNTDPAEYVEANRESIQFYANNDAQLRRLVDATFNPLPYQRVVLSLTKDELEEARQEMDRRCEAEPGRKAVTDPVVTPAAIAIATRGFTEFQNGGRCSILRQCPDCKNKYSTKVYSSSRIYWHCPHCNTIKEA